MKKSLSLSALILCFCITLSGSFVIAKTHKENVSKYTTHIKMISHTTHCVSQRKSIVLQRGTEIRARSQWNSKVYLPNYKCFVPSSSVHEIN